MNILTGLLTIFLLFGEPTFSASEEWNCDAEGAIEAEISCPDDNFLLRGMGTRHKFFLDALAGTCNNMNEQMFSDEEEVYSFFCNHEEKVVRAKCPREDHIIRKFTLCIKEDHVSAITLHCRPLNDPDKIEEVYDASSNDMDNLVNCGDNGAVQQIYLEKSEDSRITKVVFGCLKIKSEE